MPDSPSALVVPSVPNGLSVPNSPSALLLPSVQRTLVSEGQQQQPQQAQFSNVPVSLVPEGLFQSNSAQLQPVHEVQNRSWERLVFILQSEGHMEELSAHQALTSIAQV